MDSFQLLRASKIVTKVVREMLTVVNTCSESCPLTEVQLCCRFCRLGSQRRADPRARLEAAAVAGCSSVPHCGQRDLAKAQPEIAL